MKPLFCDWWRTQRELSATYAAYYAIGRAVIAGTCPRSAALEALNG
ncbi:hypothetical protein FBZ85_106147 [Azospirillum brasilense]|uniref:Uncharacterized protein n=1 Tax=Azospirillum baldaniorum TaxID=1064539 RepID=A0A9P1NRC4_9PROT|nr:hypothetical protein FBZ85_106147 [Azospirillum brasilense]CCD02912.1 protein of unknown function [Azospirillum baldaniorum]